MAKLVLSDGINVVDEFELTQKAIKLQLKNQLVELV
jgi:hypothetical protein